MQILLVEAATILIALLQYLVFVLESTSIVVLFLCTIIGYWLWLDQHDDIAGENHVLPIPLPETAHVALVKSEVEAPRRNQSPHLQAAVRPVLTAKMRAQLKKSR